MSRAAVIPDKHLSSLQTKQLESYRSIVMVIVLANLLNAAVILLTFRESMVGNLLWLWGGCVAAFSVYALAQNAIRSRLRRHVARESEKELESLARGATLNGFLWAVAPLVVMSSADTQGQMVMGIVMAGLMFAGAFLLSHIPDAALSFTIPVGVGLILSMQFQQDAAYQFISVLLIVYMAIPELILLLGFVVAFLLMGKAEAPVPAPAWRISMCASWVVWANRSGVRCSIFR